MTTWLSTRGAAGQSAKSRTGVVVDYCEFTLTAALSTNDIIKLFKIPAMARLLAFAVDFPILDTNGTPTTTVSIGDIANSASRYASALNLGTHFSVAAMFEYPGGAGSVAGTLGTRYAADDALQLTIAAGPATSATSGTLHAWIMYEMDGGTQSGF